MELSVEILAHFLSQENAQIVFPGLRLNAGQIVAKQPQFLFLWLEDKVQVPSTSVPDAPGN